MKMKIIKTITSMLIIMGIIAMSGLLAFAETDGDYSCKMGDNVTLTYYKAEKKVVISGTGDMYDFNMFNYDFFPAWRNSSVGGYIAFEENLVIIEDGITSIGDFAFMPIGAKELIIPDSVTRIGKWSFMQSEKLEKVTLSDNITEIGENAFAECSIKSITLPSKLEYIDSTAFNYCPLEEIFIPAQTHFESKFNMAGGTIFSCSSKITVDPANPYYTAEDNILFNKSKTELIAYPRVKTDETYTIPDTVTSIAEGAVFNAYLKEITIPDSVKSIERLSIYGDNPTIRCYRNSAAEEFANEYHYTIEYLDKIGDVNKDGNIDNLDMLILKKYIVEITKDINPYAADCNFDGKYNAIDMLMIKKHIVGIILSLEPTE